MADRPRFALPALDAAPDTEAGIVLLGLDAARLLAGFGLACLADDLAEDPGLVALAVDRARHGDTGAFDLEALTAEGARRWGALRPTLDDAGLDQAAVGAVRDAWDGVNRHLARVTDLGAAARAHATACWVRRAEIERVGRTP